MTVRLLPPRLSCSMRVSLLSRYGTCATAADVIQPYASAVLPCAGVSHKLQLYSCSLAPQASRHVSVFLNAGNLHDDLTCLWPSDRAQMTLPSANSPRLMLMPSARRAPSARVRFTRSLPAKSTCKRNDLFVLSESNLLLSGYLAKMLAAF